eukprot:5829784-Amphidinium_carterae.1
MKNLRIVCATTVKLTNQAKQEQGTNSTNNGRIRNDQKERSSKKRYPRQIIGLRKAKECQKNPLETHRGVVDCGECSVACGAVQWVSIVDIESELRALPGQSITREAQGTEKCPP